MPTPSDPSVSPDARTATSISIDDPRVYFAAERTLLAWIRTGVALIGLGFLIAKFGLFLRELTLLRAGTLPDVSAVAEPLMLADRSELPGWIGGVIVILGAVLALTAGIDHMRMLRRFQVDNFIGRWRRYLSGSLTIVVGMIGILLAAYLLLL